MPSLTQKPAATVAVAEVAVGGGRGGGGGGVGDDDDGGGSIKLVATRG